MAADFGTSPVDCRKRQTATATPAQPGGLPLTLEGGEPISVNGSAAGIRTRRTGGSLRPPAKHMVSRRPLCQNAMQTGQGQRFALSGLTANGRLGRRSMAIGAIVSVSRSGRRWPPGRVGGWGSRLLPGVARGQRRRPRHLSGRAACCGAPAPGRPRSPHPRI